MTTLNAKKNMKFCRSCTVPGEKCKHKGGCIFAHTIEELDPDPCPYGTGCTAQWKEGRKCWYIHIDESKQDYADRHGFNESSNKKGKSKRLTTIEFARMVVEKINKYPEIDHTTNVGAKIMETWGWEYGTGLGKYSQGILLPVLPVPTSRTMLCESKHVKGPREKVEFVREMLPVLCHKLGELKV
jgi:hypothetical protein